MKIIIVNDLKPRYKEVPSPNASFGAPGTINQTYLHVKSLAELGHEVCSLGLVEEEQYKDGVSYIAKINYKKFIFNFKPDIIMAEGGTFMYDLFGRVLPDELKNTSILQVMHNGPAWKEQASLPYIDYWCQVANSQKKFFKIGPILNLFNAVKLLEKKIFNRKDQVLIIGSPDKIGMREAISALKKLKIKFLMLIPVWFEDRHKFNEIKKRYYGYDIFNLNNVDLIKLISESLAIIASFDSGEQCPVTILDAYSAGTLCITGKGGSLKYLNPAGIRSEIYQQEAVFGWIMNNQKEALALGWNGRRYLENSQHIVSAQKEQLKNLIKQIEKNPKPSVLIKKYWRARFLAHEKLKALNNKCLSRKP